MTAPVRHLLIPLSYLYCLAVKMRNFLYDRKFLKSYVSTVKIISVGNISAGGSGKTPLVIYIASGLMSEGFKIALLSRGYKRKSKGITVVYDGKNICADINNSGDEAYMTVKSLLENYSGFYSLVAENRIEGVKYIEKNFNADFIILDDAFQHRKIHRNRDILVIDANDFINRKFYYKYLLPAGNLREPLMCIKRASVIVQNDKISPAQTLPELSGFHLPIFHSSYSVNGIFNHQNKKTEIKNKNVLAFSGVANPDSFLALIKNEGGITYKSVTFPDHKKYSQSDLDKIIRVYRKDSVIITTEKDFVKIAEFDRFVNDYPVYYLKINMQIDNRNDFYDLVKC
jgi:tetraacyldisaccharide 4'-kinase